MKTFRFVGIFGSHRRTKIHSWTSEQNIPKYLGRAVEFRGEACCDVGGEISNGVEIEEI